jgi:hypothetical protein|tara:strand:- start:4200 stop:4418 length:219 start_codon:yes stop_codon:yes gene_type:complete
MDSKPVKQEATAQIRATKTEVTLICNALSFLTSVDIPTEPKEQDWKAPYGKLLNDYERIKKMMVEHEEKHSK